MSMESEVPALSVIVVAYDMRREIERTLYSLSEGYQRGMDGVRYEVVVVDNGSPVPLEEGWVRGFGSGFRLHRPVVPQPSPAAALNEGYALARGRAVCFMIDGARIASPGLLSSGIRALGLHPRAVVATLGWHLGSELQQAAVAKGYNSEAEDALLEEIGWMRDGYRLFEISVFAGSSKDGWFMPLAESNALFLGRAMAEELGGFDERFAQSGGGLVNHDYFGRACAAPGAQVVLLLGEGTFHQVHGGSSTSGDRWERDKSGYREVTGREYRLPEYKPWYFGAMPEQALRFLRLSIEKRG